MTTLNLLEQNPKTTILIKEWFMNKLLKSMEVAPEVPDDFKDMLKSQSIENSNLEKMIDGMPRSLFDFFDEHKIYIQINVSEGPVFSYSINEGAVIAGGWEDRTEADKASIEQSFEMLEKQL
tara:strand:- start:80 stop:445 length:366 start_codon:yes stop_codon:yes gene_type:complete